VGLDLELVACRAFPSGATRVRSFAIASGEALPFQDESFDVVVCNHVYEHVDNAACLISEIRRVLKEAGHCYFAGGHRLQVVEPHYRLPFLSWLPRDVASRVLRWTGRGVRYEEAFVYPWRMRSMFRHFSTAELISIRMLQEWRRYALAPVMLRSPPTLPRIVAAIAARLAPTYIWLLKK